MSNGVKSGMIDMFYVTTRICLAGSTVSQVTLASSGVAHEIEVENCSGFPADVTTFAELPQCSTGVRFDQSGTDWTGEAKKMQRDETRTLMRKILWATASAGTEVIHTDIKEYLDRNAGSVHRPSMPNPLVLQLKIT